MSAPPDNDPLRRLLSELANLFQQATRFVEEFVRSPIAGIKAVGTLIIAIILLLAALVAARESGASLAYAGVMLSGWSLFVMLLAFVWIDTT